MSKDEVENLVLGQSFTLVTADKAQIPLVFNKECCVNLSWNYNLSDPEWAVNEQDGDVVLHVGRHDFTPRQAEPGLIEFVDEKRGEKILPTKGERFTLESLEGEWVDMHYAHLVMKMPKMPPPPPPCVGLDSFYVPKVIFTKDSCTIVDLCSRKTTTFAYNGPHSTVLFGDPCTEMQQWRIKEVSPKEIVVDIRFVQDGRVGFEYDKRYFKP